MATQNPKSQNVIHHPRNSRHVTCIAPLCPDDIWVISLLNPERGLKNSRKTRIRPPTSQLLLRIFRFQEHQSYYRHLKKKVTCIRSFKTVSFMDSFQSKQVCCLLACRTGVVFCVFQVSGGAESLESARSINQ